MATALTGCSSLAEESQQSPSSSTAIPTKTPSPTQGQSPRSENGSILFTVETDEFVVVTDDNAVESLVFTLQNQTPYPFALDPHAWTIERKTTDRWTKATDGGRNGEQVTVASGEEYHWSFSLTQHPTPLTETTTFVTADLPEGTYAFVVTGTLDDEEHIIRRAQFTLTIRTPEKSKTTT